MAKLKGIFTLKNSLIFLAVFVLLAATSYFLFFGKEKEIIVPLSKSWEKVVPNQQVPEGLVSLKAEDCGTCHKAHYEEWRLSTHAHAWNDLQFQAELKKESSPFMCINCHIPLQNQQEFIVTGLINGDIYRPVKEKNPHFDAQLQKEGINCASCHVRDNVIIGPTGTELAPHKVRKDTVHLSEKLCISCHNANAVITPTLACTFQTGEEWKVGPFYKEKNCISCHMPEKHRPIVAGYPARKSHFHAFPGSGIPKFDTVETKQLISLSYKPTSVQASYTTKDTLKYLLQIKNEFAGHRVPTGDPERYILIDLVFKNEIGKVVHSKQYRIGEQWEWYPEAKKISDNNLNPGEARNYPINALFKQKGKYKLDVKVTKYRLSEQAAEYNKLGKNYPRFITIYDKTYDFVVK